MIVPDKVTRWRSLADKNRNPNVTIELTLAMIWQESEGDRWAYNPEPRYPWLWNVKTNKPFRAPSPAELSSMTPPADWPCLGGDADQEWWGQMASWGLMQPMGAVARERGFMGKYLTELCDPEINIRIATLHLWVYGYESGKRSTADALKRYNGSAPYADKVIAKMMEIEK